MSSICGFITLSSLGIPSHSRTVSSKNRSFSRREALITLASIPLFMSRHAAAQHLSSDLEDAVRLLRERCTQFISMIHPVRNDALLWRGADSDKDFALRSPHPDLLTEDTYGAQGASFFRDLDQFLMERQNEDTVLPSRAHIGTGDPRVAGNWGTPVSIWPVGQIRYAYWRDSSLIYEDGDSLETSRNRGGRLIFGDGLREALVDGKEVMFEAQAFFEVSGQLTASVLDRISDNK